MLDKKIKPNIPGITGSKNNHIDKNKTFNLFSFISSILFKDILKSNTPTIKPIIKIKELTYVEDPTEEEIEEEIRFDEMEMIAQLVMAEAGNQDLMGKRYVVDVVLNRVDSDDFPDTVEEVIFQKNQFSVIENGDFDDAGWTITEECYEAVKMEYEERLNYDILYFSRGPSKYASNHFKHQDHWFGW